MQPDAKLKKLEAILKAIDEGVTRDEFVTAFEMVIKIVKDLRAGNVSEFDAIHRTVTLLGDKLSTTTASDVDAAKNELRAAVAKAITDTTASVQAKLNEVNLRLATLQNGPQGPQGESIVGPPGKDGSPDMAEDIRNKLELLEGDERLDASAIRNLPEVTKQIVREAGNRTRGIQLYVGGAKKGLAQYLNLIAGSGVTLSYNYANGRNDVTISATGGGGGGSLAVLAATGTVNDSNVSFTFVSTPTLVIVNGSAYRHGHGVTIAGTTATLDSPVGTAGDIYALG